MITFVHDHLRMPRVVFAPGALERVADETAALGGTRVLVVAAAHAACARRRVEEALGRRIAAVVDEVVQHVPANVAARAIEAADRSKADVAVCIGGGSATGLGKAVALERGLPLLAVPTTYAGSEMTDIWGLTEGQHKRTGRDERVRPRTVVYDPELTVSMPSAATATSGMNALAHCVEAAYAADASPIVRLLAVEGVRALADALPRCVAQPSDLDARSRALYGAWLAGMTLGDASMGIHHKLCHVLGGAYRLPPAAWRSSFCAAPLQRRFQPRACSRCDVTPRRRARRRRRPEGTVAARPASWLAHVAE